MEPRHPGALSSLRLRRRNPPVSSLHVGSCGRLGLRRPRSSRGGRAGWPGALLVNGDLVGTWRRQVGRVTVRAWRPLEPEIKEAVEEEVSRMPIESATKEVRWSAGDGPL